MSENRVLLGIFESRKSLVAGGFRRVHIKELHKCTACLVILRLKWRRTRWTRHVTCTRKSELLKIVTANTKERRPVVGPMYEWEVRALKENAQVMEQSEHEEKKKYTRY